MFLPNPGQEEEGLAHAGIETFKGAPYAGLARECSQNSLDAAERRADGSPQPVHMVFKLLLVPATDIPGLPELKVALRTCLDQWKDQKKEREFFTRAINIANQSTIPVLCVEDYGTTGLAGPALKGNPFHALVKSTGISQKSDVDARGSFGIGKNAAFAISGLRTVFYSTIYRNGNYLAHLAQGKSILVSHEHMGEPRRATGYWGNPDYMPVDDDEVLPAWLRRTEVGTTVASAGFFVEQDWHWLMVESLIRNFFSAIGKSSVRFTVHWSETDAIEINAASLGALFTRQEVLDAAENNGTTEKLIFSSAMHAALSSNDSEVFIENFAGVGAFRMTLLQRDELPRRVGILRNGMYIADNLSSFGHAMARFPMSRDFVAIVEPNDRDTSGRFRDMESPKHDEISADRIDDASLRRSYKSAMKKLGDWVRHTIRASTTKPAEADVLLDEMNQFFSNSNAERSVPDPGDKNEDPERVKVIPNPLVHKSLVGSGSQGESGSSGGSKKSTEKGGITSGGQTGRGRGAVGGRGGKSIAYSGLRNSVSDGGRRRRIAFNPDATANAFLEISAVGVAADEAMNIKSINGDVCRKKPLIQLRQGERLRLDVEFDSPYTGPINLVLGCAEEVGDED
ncbi:MAG: hypothetical protein ACTHOH_01225 [Lysobacteraceae bacterium]